MTPIGLFRVGSPAGYASRCALYSVRTRPGIAKAADFPLPVAVQQSISWPSRIEETSLSCTRCSPSLHVGIIVLTMVRMVSRLIGSCQWAPVAICEGSYGFNPFKKWNKSSCKNLLLENHWMSRRQWRSCRYIDAMRHFKVRRLHNNFLTQFGGCDMKQTTYTREPYKSIKFTCIVVCLRETMD